MDYKQSVYHSMYNLAINNGDKIKSLDKIWRKTKADKHFINKGGIAEISYNKLFGQIDSRGKEYPVFIYGLFINEIHSLLIKNPEILSIIEVGNNPYYDKLEKENKQALNNLAGGFRANMNFKTHIGDGNIIYPNGDKIPLEVGTTSPLTLAWHLETSSGFARWPYESKFIYSFKKKNY